MSNIEKELKHLIDKNAFRRLYNYLCLQRETPTFVKQVNYYFDSKDLSMQQQGINIRIRLKVGKAELTCKIPIEDSWGADFINCYEFNCPLSLEDANSFILNGISHSIAESLLKKYLYGRQIKFYNLYCFGHLRTARLSFNLEETIEPLLMDINTYLGIFDYELEWESTNIDKARNMLAQLFKDTHISSIAKMETKRKRFFNRWEA